MIIRKLFFTLVALFAFLLSEGQKTDSLKALLREATGLERVDILYALAFSYIDVNNDSALKHSLQGFDIARSFGDSLRMVKSGLLVASALRRSQRIDSSILVYHTIVDIADRQNYPAELALALNSMAIAYTFRAEYDKALKCYFRSLALRESTGDTTLRIPVITNIALVYYKLKDYRTALKMFLECHELRRKTGYMDDEDLLLMNIGHCYAYLGEFSNAALFIERALEYCGTDCSPSRVLEANFVRGVIFFGRKQYGKSELYFLEAYALAKELNDVRFQLDNIDYLAQIYTMRNQTSSAAFYLAEAEKLIGLNNSFNLERIKIYSRFSELFLKSRDFETASRYQLKYSQLKDSVYSEQMTINLMKAESEFAERENVARISAQNQVLQLKEEIIRHQKALNKVMALLATIVIAFAILLFLNYQQKTNINILLERKIKERTIQLEISLDESLRASQERDLLFTRSELGVTQTMRSIKGLCLTGMREVTDPVARSYFERIVSSASNLLRDLRPQSQKSPRNHLT